MLMSYFYVTLTIFFTVYGQIALKWQISSVGELPLGISAKLWFLLKLFSNPWVLSAFLSAFLASLAWMAAMSKLEISHAYPFMSLNFVLVLLLSGLLFHEPITINKVAGMILLILGLIIGSRG